MTRNPENETKSEDSSDLIWILNLTLIKQITLDLFIPGTIWYNQGTLYKRMHKIID